jgi:hypothetical protein
VVQRQDAAEYLETLNYISFDVGVRHLGVAAASATRPGGTATLLWLDLADVTADEEDAGPSSCTYLENALQSSRWSAYVVSL